MRSYLPKLTHFIPWLGIALFSAVGWMLEQYFSNQPWWQKIPFMWGAIFLFVFWFGVMVQDCCNKDSWIRRKIRSFRKLFVIEVVVPASKTTESHEWLEVKCRIRFIRNAKNVRVVLRAHSCINIDHARRDFILETSRFDEVHKGQQQIFILAILPIKSHGNKESLGYQCWGQHHRKSGDTDGMKSLSDNSQNFVEVEMKSGWKTQIEHIFFDVMNKSSYKPFIVYKNHPTSLMIEPQKAINS